MKKIIFALVISALLAFGCLGGGKPEASATPTPEPTKLATVVTIDPSLDSAIDDSAAQSAELEKLTNEIDQADISITDDELGALG
ncbi:MAG TPA: hypothetical protein VJI13_02465 [Candidatus Norongarragalinales archaeon]|nr:hypothetical protein [Candidatus Norongarragalinales archaeon]